MYGTFVPFTLVPVDLLDNCKRILEALKTAPCRVDFMYEEPDKINLCIQVKVAEFKVFSKLKLFSKL